MPVLLAASVAEVLLGVVWLGWRWWFARRLRWFRVTAVRPGPARFRFTPVAGTVTDERTGEVRELVRTTVPVVPGDVVRCGPAGPGRVRLLPTPRTTIPAALVVRGTLLLAFGLAAVRVGLDHDVTGTSPASYLLVAWTFTLLGALSVGTTAGRLRFARRAREVPGEVTDARRWVSRAPNEPKVRYTVYGRTRSAWVGRYSFLMPRTGAPVVVSVDPRAEASARRTGGSLGIWQFLGDLAGFLGALQFLGALGVFG